MGLTANPTELHFPQTNSPQQTNKQQHCHSPVVEKDLLIVISCFDKSKVIFQGCHVSQKPLRAVIASQHPDRNSCLQTSSLHFTDTELDLLDRSLSIPEKTQTERDHHQKNPGKKVLRRRINTVTRQKEAHISQSISQWYT